MVELRNLFDIKFTFAGYGLEGVSLADVVGSDFEEAVGEDGEAVVVALSDLRAILFGSEVGEIVW